MLHAAADARENLPSYRSGLIGQLGDIDFFATINTDQSHHIPQLRFVDL